jgi:hypothetical protein
MSEQSETAPCVEIWMRGMMRTRYMLALKLSEISRPLERDIAAREEIKEQIKAIDAQTVPWRMPENVEVSHE